MIVIIIIIKLIKYLETVIHSISVNTDYLSGHLTPILMTLLALSCKLLAFEPTERTFYYRVWRQFFFHPCIIGCHLLIRVVLIDLRD